MIRIIAAVILLSISPAHAEWIQYSETENGAYFYDPKRVIKQPGGLVAVWVKVITSPERMIERRNLRNLPIKGYENYSHSLDKDIYSCSDRTVATSSITYYTNAGATLESLHVKKQDLRFDDVIPESLGETLFNLVCKIK